MRLWNPADPGVRSELCFLSKHAAKGNRRGDLLRYSGHWQVKSTVVAPQNLSRGDPAVREEYSADSIDLKA